MEADFSGYATKAGLKCSDGRTITPEAFKHMDGMQVPLVWQHGHDKAENVLGHAVLEARDDGMYTHGFFNETSQGQNAKLLVEHKDVKALSIYANQLVEKSKTVLHGMIREVSLVLAGANPGAFIEHVRIAHSDDDIEILEEDAIISTGLELEHSDKSSENDAESENEDNADANEENEGENKVEHALAPDATVQDVFDTFTEEQKQVVHFMIGAAIEAVAADAAAAHSDDTNSDANNDEGNLNHQEGTDTMGRNVFDQNATKPEGPTLSHSDLKGIVEKAQQVGSFKKAFEEYALAHSITDIDMLFPDAKLVTSGPELIARRTEWVASILDGAKHSPFSRIKSLAADLTADEARAKGYVKGNLKKEEIIRLLKRVTTPTTIYKKQKLDRDDIIDITDLDVVAWLKGEMRLMLEEELAAAVLVGDGREPDDEDKIDEEKLRPIAWDDEMYAHSVTVPANITADAIVESVLRSRKFYRGTGQPTFYTTDDVLTDMILVKDKVGRRLYMTEAELAAALRVDKIVVVEVLERFPDLMGIIVNIADYTIGADRGGSISMFDDFDIDYNQYKYLIETRASGALTKPKSAVVIKRTSGTTVSPSTPAFNSATNTITIPAVTGVKYYDVTNPVGSGTLLTTGAHVITTTTDVEARADSGYTFPHNIDNDWTFAYTA